METWIQIVSTVGFPICTTMALAYFVYTAFKQITSKSEAREERLYVMLGKSQMQIDNCIETNAKFVAQLEDMRHSINSIQDDIDDIKDAINIKEVAETTNKRNY